MNGAAPCSADFPRVRPPSIATLARMPLQSPLLPLPCVLHGWLSDDDRDDMTPSLFHVRLVRDDWAGEELADALATTPRPVLLEEPCIGR